MRLIKFATAALFVALGAVVAVRGAAQTPPAAAGAQEPAKLPEGAGRDAIVKACNDCHTVEEHLAPRRSRHEWADIVDDMISKGAQVADADHDKMVAYLSANFGKKIKINEATAAEIQAALEIPEAQAAAIVKYRDANGKFKVWKDLTKVPGANAARIEEQKDNFEFGG